jgi:hypothetical protein
MPVVHATVGALLIVTNTLVAAWGFIAYRRNAPPGDIFRHALAAAQTLVIAQAFLGLVLISQNYGRPAALRVRPATAPVRGVPLCFAG